MSGMHQIKASAGAGKTYTLTREFLKLLVKCSPGGVKQDACRARFAEEWDEDENYIVYEELKEIFPALTCEKISECCCLFTLER